MSTEAILLLGLFAFLLLGGFLGDTGPRAIFAKSGPKLGARIELHLMTGDEFRTDGDRLRWEIPNGGAPGSGF